MPRPNAPIRSSLAIVLTALVLVTLPLLAAYASRPFLITDATEVVIFALAVAGLDFIVGYGGLVSLGHAAFFAIGAYTVAVAAGSGIDSALISWPLAVLVSAAFAGGIGALSLRTSGAFFIMITLAFAQMIYFLIVGIRFFGGDDGLIMTTRSVIPGIDLANPLVFYFVALALLAAFVTFSRRAAYARFGTVVRAAKQSERRVSALGFDVYRYRLVAFVISGAATGLAGALFADFERIASPSSATWLQSGELLVMAILGGTGLLLGPIFGAAAFVILKTVLLGLTDHWMFVLGPILIFVVLVAKRGIAGLIVGPSDA